MVPLRITRYRADITWMVGYYPMGSGREGIMPGGERSRSTDTYLSTVWTPHCSTDTYYLSGHAAPGFSPLCVASHCITLHCIALHLRTKQFGEEE